MCAPSTGPRALLLLLVTGGLGCIASGPSEAYRAERASALRARPEADARHGAGAPRADGPAPARAPELTRDTGPLALSVEEALLLSLQHNQSLAVQRLQSEVVGAYEAIERGAFDAELFARIGYGRDVRTEATDVTGEQFAVSSDSDSVVAGVRQQLPTGTAVELSASRARSASSRRPEQYESRLGLTLTQALLRGFGPAVNLAQVRVAESDSLASLWELRGFTEALIAETEAAYWRHVLAERSVVIVQRALEVTAQQLSEVEQFIAVGKLAPFDAAALRAELSRRKQSLIDAESARQLERLRLSRLLGLPKDVAARALVTKSEPRIEPAPLTDVPERVELALRSRADLNEARMRVERQALRTVMTRNGLLPQLDLFVTLGKSGYADSFGRSVEDLPGDSFDFAAGLELTHALGNRQASGRDLVARYEAEAARAALANLRELVELDVQSAALELERARQQIAASAATRTFREQSAQAQTERLRVGAATALELAQAERDLLESRLDEVRSMIDYRLAQVALYRAEGSLLERRGLRVSE